jgi:hypothetical protein
MLSFFDWIKLHKYPSKGIVEQIKIPNRYEYFMRLLHEVKKPNERDYLDSVSGFEMDINLAKRERIKELLVSWHDCSPFWLVNECYVYKFKELNKDIKDCKFLTTDALCLRYYYYCTKPQLEFQDYLVTEVPLCLHLFSDLSLAQLELGVEPLNRLFQLKRLEGIQLSLYNHASYETLLEWNAWLRETLSELGTQYTKSEPQYGEMEKAFGF